LDKLVIEGGRPLRGTVRCAGSKNAVLPIMAAALLTRGKLRITGAPRLADVGTMLEVLRELGAECDQASDGTLEISAHADLRPRAGWDNVRKMRGSVCVLGPLLARCARAEVSLPGGCVFGVRPIDVHLKGMRMLGARVTIEHGFVVAEAPRVPGRHAMILGSAFGSSVLGTANVMMAATLARGHVIQGAACEPEVVDLARFVNARWGQDPGQGSPRIEIEGVEGSRGRPTT
jgi:UDP-N-acetylglucosamine 1-carboxyvinyltransferase